MIRFDYDGGGISWAQRLVGSGSEYFTVDLMRKNHYMYVTDKNGSMYAFSSCYDVNGYIMQGCQTFLLYKFAGGWDTDCKEMI